VADGALQLMQFYLTGLGNLYENRDHILSSVVEADGLCLDGALMPDHYMWGSEIGHHMAHPYSTLETWTTLTYLAGKTRRISLGTLVTPITLRHPAVLAKMLSTLDVLSGGRVVLGVGAGWSEVEFRGYSRWLDTGARVDRTVEALNLMLRLWEEPEVTHHGKYYHAEGAVLEPKPVQKPHPRLLFGSQGRRMLSVAGRHADICFVPPWAGTKADEILSTIAEAADKAGRKVAFMLGDMESDSYDPSAYSKGIDVAEKAGASYYSVSFPRSDPSAMGRFAEEVMPSYR